MITTQCGKVRCGILSNLQNRNIASVSPTTASFINVMVVIIYRLVNNKHNSNKNALKVTLKVLGSSLISVINF